MLEVSVVLRWMPRRGAYRTPALAELLAAVQRHFASQGQAAASRPKTRKRKLVSRHFGFCCRSGSLGQTQAYHGIDPSVVPGSQIQDSGAVDFVSAGVDSEHGGCFMNAGTTYCVAPIVANGTIHHSVGGAPRYGSFDYFAVGVDCCSSLGPANWLLRLLRTLLGLS